MTEHPQRVRVKRLLVVDDDEDIVTVISQRCSELGCFVTCVNNATDATTAIRFPLDLVCIDENIPSSNGQCLCELMAADERLRNTPIIVLTGRPRMTTIGHCRDALVHRVEKGANIWERLEPLVRELLHLENAVTIANSTQRKSAPAPRAALSQDELDSSDFANTIIAMLDANEKSGSCSGNEIPSTSIDLENIPWVLCIDDDDDFSMALKIRLENHGAAVIQAFSGREGYRLAFTSPASVIVLDYNMPNGQGDYILGRLKDNPVTTGIPVVVITGTKDAPLKRRMLAMGATAFFLKPVNFGELIEHLSKYIKLVGIPG